MSSTLHPDLDETHDPALRSWVDTAVPGQSDFPIQNLPFGVFTRGEADDAPRIGVRIGDAVLDMRVLAPVLPDLPEETRATLAASTLNGFMALPALARRALRARLSALLRKGGSGENSCRRVAEPGLVLVDQARMCLPASIGSFVDFYACLNHALNAGTVLRRGEPAPLPTNWKWMPLGYHGRASSVQVGGEPVRRPAGQRRGERGAPPVFGPTRELDYEVEIGAFVGPGCDRGQQITMQEAANHIAGFVLVNDWSARDIQTWEGGPLGPFQSKSFATSISPWVVTTEALAPFRAPAYNREAEDPQPLPHLDDSRDRTHGGLNIRVGAFIRTAKMRSLEQAAQRISLANTQELYWTMQQMLTHASSNGSGLVPGDLLASGTISGAIDGTRGCLLETTQRGRVPLAIGDETRGFLEDGDEVTLNAHCERDGYVPIGFGECSAVVAPTALSTYGQQ